jgi:hemerythrin-like domain-containing protein
MSAIQILSQEHRAIERVTTALEIAAKRLSRGDDVYLRFFLGTAYFIKAFTDGCHHMKEETILCPALVSNGIPREAGPVKVMLAEHEQGRNLSQRMRQVTERLQTGDENARDQVVQSAMGYVKLVRQHIYNEDHVIFPMADKVIPAEQQQMMLESFKHYEFDETGEEIQEKFNNLAERLVLESMR